MGFLFEILLAICFVASSGIYFAARFATNNFLRSIVGGIAVVSTVLLGVEAVKFFGGFSATQTSTGGASAAVNPLTDRTEYVLLVRGTDTKNRAFFAFVTVPDFRLDEFKAAQKEETFYPEKYGNVILSGLGEPTQGDFDLMAKKYGFDQNGMKDLQ